MKLNDSVMRWVRGFAFMVAGGALQPVVDQLLIDLNDRYDPYLVAAYGLLLNALWLIFEEVKGVGIARTPEPPSAQLKARLK